MAGIDRLINTETGDYVETDSGETTETTETAITAIYHQIKTHKGGTFIDPDAGSRVYQLSRAKSGLRSDVVIRDIYAEALAPLVEDKRITSPAFEGERLLDRVNSSITATDLKTREELDLLNLLPYLP